MKVSRRIVLGALAASALPLGGCNQIISQLTNERDFTLLEGKEELDPAFHLLNRAAYGPSPGDLKAVRALGESAWLARQLDPQSIDDRKCDLRARRFETLYADPGLCREFKRSSLRSDLVKHTLLRAVYSKRQLYEVMVGFWSDHFNISLEKGDCIYLKAQDDQMIRKHAFGKFPDLLRASALSPAMLVYLDGCENKKTKASDIPNENYARELLELHTMGVDGGYTQKDVQEAARCLTGFTVKKGRPGHIFDPNKHDDGAKVVLGEMIAAGGGASDLDKLLAIVSKHPATARHISKKMISHFVSEDIKQNHQLQNKLAGVFSTTGGDTVSMLDCLFKSSEFARSKGAKLKRPFHYVASSLRALCADTHARPELTDYLIKMGHAPFQYPTPDGYPDESSAWLSTLLWRWNFAFALCHDKLPDVSTVAKPFKLDNLAPVFATLVGRLPTKEELSALREGRESDWLALILASPAFQRC